MTVTTPTSAETLTDDEAALAPADSATDLLNAMAAMPAGHPSRAAMRDRAIEAWLPLARHLAHRYSGRGEPTNDLIQTTNNNQNKTNDKNNPKHDNNNANNAIPTIIGEIMRHFRDRTW